MPGLAFSTIAHLLYHTERAPDFARVVAELQAVLGRRVGATLTIVWDCDDLVTFDLGPTRILMSCADIGRAGGQICLTLSCGPSHREAAPLSDCRALCLFLVRRLQARFVETDVVWHTARGPVDADLVDRLVTTLPPVAVPAVTLRLPPVESILDQVLSADHIKTKVLPKHRSPDLSTPQNTRPILFMPPAFPSTVAQHIQPNHRRSPTGTLARLRAALFPTTGQTIPQNTPMRLTALCFNATLILIYMPLGVAVMTYAILKGEDMRLSARLMAICGTLFAVAHTPLGHAVKTVVGV